MNPRSPWLASMQRYRVLPRQQQELLLIEYHKDPDSTEGQRIKEKLIKHNMPLVIRIASKYLNHGVEFDDLVSEGALGLKKAIEKFNPKTGCQLSTYATWWIRQGITRAIADQGRTIRLPVYLVEEVRKLRKASRTFSQQKGRSPNIIELAELLELSVERVRFLIEVKRPVLSLNYSGEGYDAEVGDFLPSSENPWRSVDKQWLDNLMNRYLDERERFILKKRSEDWTLGEIGDRVGLTKERVRQVYNKAIAKLQAALGMEVAA